MKKVLRVILKTTGWILGSAGVLFLLFYLLAMGDYKAASTGDREMTTATSSP